MASVPRKLLSSTLTINIPIPSCPPGFCFKFCSCELPPPPPPPPPPPREHHLVPTIIACVMGVFFILGMVCIVAGLKYLKRIVSRRRNPPLVFITRDDFVDQDHVPVINHPIWLINFVGLEQSVIDSITVCKYKRGHGLVQGTECSVCLGQFEEDEDLRLLPKCSHAFHLPCIDTWLRSHKNCPLCRAPIVSSTAAVASEPAGEETQLQGSENGLDHQQVGEDVARSEIDGAGDVGYGSATPNIALIWKCCDSRALSGLAENGEMGFEDVSSASVICDAGAELGESKNPSKLAGSGSSSSSSRNTSTSTSLCRLMKSASLGRTLQKGPVSMKRSSSSRNCRSLDLVLPM